MTALKVILLLLLLLWLISMIRVGGVAEYSEDGLFVWLRVGAFRITVFPFKPKEKKKAKTKKPAQNAQKGSHEAAHATQKSKKRGGMLGLVLEMLPLLLDTVNLFRKKIRIAPLEILLTIPGTEDPAQSAIRYGQANAVLGGLWPALNEAFDIRDGRAGTRVDFLEEQFRLYIKAGISIRIGQALWIGIRFGVAGLITFMKYRANNRKAECSCGKQSSDQ